MKKTILILAANPRDDLNNINREIRGLTQAIERSNMKYKKECYK